METDTTAATSVPTSSQADDVTIARPKAPRAARGGRKTDHLARKAAGDILGAYLAGPDCPEDSHLSAGRPPHTSICVWKTIGPLRIVGHVFPLGNLCKSQLQLSYSVWRGGLLHWVGG
jgi:hypothetical protein